MQTSSKGVAEKKHVFGVFWPHQTPLFYSSITSEIPIEIACCKSPCWTAAVHPGPTVSRLFNESDLGNSSRSSSKSFTTWGKHFTNKEPIFFVVPMNSLVNKQVGIINVNQYEFFVRLILIDIDYQSLIIPNHWLLTTLIISPH
jgi:hypothetical protein